MAIMSFLSVWMLLTTLALGKTSHFKLELTWGKGAPDGFERDMIFVNGKYPGPTLEVDEGDWVEIDVVNKMPFNTSLHAHGIHQTKTPWADGVPGLSQRPIQPGATFKYKWHADLYGSYFYHAHSRGQIDDGCYGPIIIKPRAETPKPFSKISSADVSALEEAERKAKPLLLSDWRHRTSDQTWHDQLASGIESAVCMDSLLFNGKGAVDCWPREQIDALTPAALAPILKPAGLQFTEKGCIPPEAFPILLGNSSAIHPDTIPPEVFKICTPTKGSREIIHAPKQKKWLALDLISTASIATFAFSIDEHPLWVYAVDGHYIEPMRVDVLTVTNGDRYSVFIELNKKGGNYGIRLASLAAIQVIDSTAVLSYDSGDGYAHYENSTDIVSSTPSINRGGLPLSPNATVFNQAKMVSFPAQFPQPPPQVAQTFIMTLGTVGNSYTWALNATPFDHPKLDDSNPPLLYQTPSASNPGDNITIVTKNNTWVDLVFIVPELGAPPHPIHKHSNRAFVLGAGEGTWNWTTVAEAAKAIPQNFNLVTPPYRDGFATPPTATQPTWLAVRYHVVNPGAFMMHCHIQSHLNGGMAMVMLDGVDEWPEVPGDCKNE